MDTTSEKQAYGIGAMLTFGASLAAACSIAIACASVVAFSQAAPGRGSTPAAVEVVRLDPVVVTMPRAQFDAERAATADDSTIVRAEEARTSTRG